MFSPIKRRKGIGRGELLFIIVLIGLVILFGMFIDTYIKPFFLKKRNDLLLTPASMAIYSKQAFEDCSGRIVSVAILKNDHTSKEYLVVSSSSGISVMDVSESK